MSLGYEGKGRDKPAQQESKCVIKWGIFNTFPGPPIFYLPE